MHIRFPYPDDWRDGDVWPGEWEYGISDSGCAELEELGIDHLAQGIVNIVATAKFYGEHPPLAELKDRLKNSRDGLKQFIRSINSAGPIGAREIIAGKYDFADDEPTDLDDEDYREDAAWKLEHFIQRAEFYKERLNCVLEQSIVPKGRLKNVVARNIAKQLAKLFVENGLVISSYYDGTFFKSLRILLRECMPDIGKEAYRRHGLRAINNLPMEYQQPEKK